MMRREELMAKEAWELQDASDGRAAALWEHGQRIHRLFHEPPATPPQEVRYIHLFSGLLAGWSDEVVCLCLSLYYRSA